MHNGLKPSIRGFKGVGFNRPLPSPFDFEKSYKPDGVNDIFSVPGMVGTIFPSQEFSLELWTNRTLTSNSGYFLLTDNINTIRLFVNDSNNLVFQQRRISDAQGGLLQLPFNLYTGRLHIVATASAGVSRLYINGQLVSSSTWRNDLNLVELTRVNLGYCWLFGSGGDGYLKEPADEFRVYRKALTADEVRLNYNTGHGENPCTTEHLHAWWKFNEFEDLGSGLVNSFPVDVRDYGPNAYHAKAANMVTNPADANYVFKEGII